MPAPDALPTRVRARVVAVAADALGAMPPDQVPAALRRVAAFSPARRAKVAAGQLLAALEDDAFREHLAVQARAQAPEVAGALEHGERSPETAALAYLVRGQGWESVLAEVAGAEEAERAERAAVAERDEVVALRARLADRDRELDDVRRDLDAARAEARTETAAWRRKVGDARAQA
ncbi:hypothetical protein AB4Y76_20415, partial [Marmoricola sp. RAF53]